MSAISTPLPTPTDNYETQIDTASVSASALSFDVTDANADTNLPSEFIGVLYQKDADGEVVAGSVEYIHVTGVSGQTISLTDINDRGLTGSDNGAQAYSQNDYFGIWVTSYYYDSLKSVIGNATQTLDEDDMASDSATALATQQSIKAYVDSNAFPTDGWVADTATWTYASATSFTIAGVDVTAKFQKGTKIKLTNDSSTKYFYVTSSSFSTNTTVNITGGTDYTLANSAISDTYYSYSDNPQGFPAYFNYTPTLGAGGSMTFSSTTVTYAFFTVQGKTVIGKMRISGTTGGSASAYLTATVPIARGNSTAYEHVGNGRVADGGSETGYMTFDDTSTTVLRVNKGDDTNYTLGAGRGSRFVFTYFL